MNGHEKGAEYERVLSRQLSLWLTDGRSNKELWRSIGSGAHAGRFGKKQGGDIASISLEYPQVVQFCERFFIEAKHYRRFDWIGLLVHGTGELYQFWHKAVEQAQMCGKMPVLIAKENRRPAVLVCPGLLRHVQLYSLSWILAQPPEHFLNTLYNDWAYCKKISSQS